MHIWKFHFKSSHVKTVVLLCVSVPIQLLLAAYLSCLMIFYTSMFPTVRRYIVETTMSTYTHQYFSRMFLPDAEIQEILAQTAAEKAAKQKVADVHISKVQSRNIEQYEISGKNYHGWLLVVSDPTRIKVGYTKFLMKVGETTSGIAKDNSAVAAINGGGFSGGNAWTGTGAIPAQFVFSNGSLVFLQDGFSKTEDTNVIALNRQGKLIVGSHSIEELQKMGVSEAVTMPGYEPLIVNGEGTYKDNSSVGMNPRTAIGQTKDGSILLLVLDGRRINMLGATLPDVQNVLLSRGAYNAAELDGGSSTTMYYNGKIINQPSGAYGERTVATAFYVTK